MAKKPLDGSSPTDWLAEQLVNGVTRPNALTYRPHKKQVMFHNADAVGRLYIGGNRSGKSVGGIVEDIWWLTGTHPYRPTPKGQIRGRIVCVDFIQGIGKIIVPMLQQWIPKSALINGSWEDSYTKESRTLTLANGSFVELMTYEQDLAVFAGTSRHFIHFDEEPPQDIFTECLLRLVDTNGSWWMTMTPVEGMSWIYDQIYLVGKRGDNHRVAVIEVDMMENPYLTQEGIDNAVSLMSSEDKEARLHGKFIQIGGLVYKKFDPSIHVVKSWTPPPGMDIYESMDHGYNNPTAFLWHAVTNDGDVITFSEHYEAERTVEYHADMVHRRRAQFKIHPVLTVGDPATAQRQGVTGTSIQTEYATRGIHIHPGNNDVLVGVAKVASYLEVNKSGKPRWLITEDCPNLINEMQRLRWKTWASKKMANRNNKYDQIHKKDDHACDSARYFFTVMPDLTPVRFDSPDPIPLSAQYGVDVAGRMDDFLIAQKNSAIRTTAEQDAKWDLVFGD